MPAPTYVTNYSPGAWSNTTTPASVSVTVANGDAIALVVLGDGGVSTSSPSGGGLTYNSRASRNTGTEGYVNMYVAEVNADATFTLSVSMSGGHMFSFDVLRFSSARDAANGVITTIPDSSTNNGYANLTTANANSSVVACVNDFNAVSAASRNWWEDGTGATAGTETDYFTNGSNYTVGIGYWADAGTAAAHTFGLLNNTTAWGHTIAGAVELKYQAPSAPVIANNAALAYHPAWRRSLLLGR